MVLINKNYPYKSGAYFLECQSSYHWFRSKPLFDFNFVSLIYSINNSNNLQLFPNPKFIISCLKCTKQELDIKFVLLPWRCARPSSIYIICRTTHSSYQKLQREMIYYFYNITVLSFVHFHLPPRQVY